jgi:transcriptional regulator with XRE-family HTH domain
MSAYSDWLMQRFIEWERTKPRRQSYTAFARYLGVNQSSLSQWLAGTYPPSGENVEKIASKLGEEIYLLVGELPPAMKEELDRFGPDKPAQLLSVIARFLRENRIAE